jgi:hypothetical protein
MNRLGGGHQQFFALRQHEHAGRVRNIRRTMVIRIENRSRSPSALRAVGLSDVQAMLDRG